MRRVAAVACLLAGALLGAVAPAGGAPAGGPLVDVVEVSGVIDATVAGYLRDTVRRAEDAQAEALVVQLDTPGGLGAGMQEVVAAITASRVPVVVWVGPAGARAAGAGAVVAHAAHVLALAPATTLGPAVPVDVGDSHPDAAARDATASRLAALARQRGRDVSYARRAASAGAVVAVGDAGRLPADAQLPPGVERDAVEVVAADAVVDRRLADVVAGSLPDVLAALDGRRVAVAAEGGGTQLRRLVVDQATASVRFHNLGLVRRVLHTVADPTLAYLLLVAGALAMAFELFQPGFGVAGVSGVVLLGLALYGLSVLPVNWLAVGLLLAGLALLAADLAIAGLGAPTVAGAVALAAGSSLLFSGSPALRLPAWVIAAAVALSLVFFVVVMTSVLRAQGGQPLAGAHEVVGKVGVVRSTLNPEGHVFVAGALWRARAAGDAGQVPRGTRVRVLGLDEGGLGDRLTLEVALAGDDADEPSTVG